MPGRTYRSCPVCDMPMKGGQRQKALPDGRKAHGVCVETSATERAPAKEATPGGLIDATGDAAPREMGDDEFVALFRPTVVEAVEALLPAVMAELRPVDGSTPPEPVSKSSLLVGLLHDSSAKLSARLKAGEPRFDLEDVQSMARAAAVLDIVALYIAEAN